MNIDPGMVFRYTFRETGVVLRIELIGLERTAESASYPLNMGEIFLESFLFKVFPPRVVEEHRC